MSMIFVMVNLCGCFGLMPIISLMVNLYDRHVCLVSIFSLMVNLFVA